MRYLDTAFKQLPITSEVERWVVLVYQIRNAFAHDISEPRWKFRNPRFARVYTIGRVKVDLSGLDGRLFEYSHIGGPDVLFTIKESGMSHVFGSPA